MDSLRFDLDVQCRPEHAFAVWTGRIDTWWPADHTVSGDPAATVVLEPYVGGRIFERTPDGVECEWGSITRWEPPDRLDYRWHLRTSPERATDVSITFASAPGGRTRVSIEHTGWERLGADASSWRDRNTGGWSTLLPHYTAALDQLDEKERIG